METVIENETPTPNNTEGVAASEGATEAAPASTDSTQLKAELEAVNAKAAEYLDGWQRARADFANYKKRIEREQADSRQTIAAEVLARVLPALDDFELALKNAPTNGDGAKWAEGVTLVHRKLTTILENEGIKRIEAEGRPFDPNLHEAVVHEESADHAEGHVTAVLRQGYKLGDRVLRPALVKVAK
ncbi:MAG: nucleotide exchange factor GrpE [Chloroflexi bacterium]|nr:nucleotide exchange factor GrpE [Chloroflexota bacterium]